ncbi:MAG: winged helix-turn-helix domain-containing protein [Thermoplasmata archaeon]
MSAGPTPGSGPVGRRRERTDLYATILEVVKRYHGEARITRVSYGAGMPVDRLRVSVDKLVALGLLKRTAGDDLITYDLTPRGQEFLASYWKMKAFTDLLERP